jgi:hypothetical protein
MYGSLIFGHIMPHPEFDCRDKSQVSWLKSRHVVVVVAAVVVVAKSRISA